MRSVRCELKRAIGNIPTTKKLVLLDTCHSGALGDALALTTRGLEDDAAVKILSTGAVGSAVLAASSSQQQALEGQKGHGLFTWVVVCVRAGWQGGRAPQRLHQHHRSRRICGR